MSSHGFAITINNYTFTDVCELISVPHRYICFSFEVAPSTGTPHIQGYLYTHDKVRSSFIVKFFTRKPHVEIAKGTLEQNRKYCLGDYPGKEINSDFYEFGDPTHQGFTSWEGISYIMDHPEENFHLYQQYRKSYKEYKNSKKKNHERKLYIAPSDDKYNIAKCCDSVCLYDSEYLDEEVYIVPCYADGFVDDWVRGFPPRFRNGYEYLYKDPQVVYILYDNVKEERYLKKKYLDYIDNAE